MLRMTVLSISPHFVISTKCNAWRELCAPTNLNTFASAKISLRSNFTFAMQNPFACKNFTLTKSKFHCKAECLRLA